MIMENIDPYSELLNSFVGQTSNPLGMAMIQFVDTPETIRSWAWKKRYEIITRMMDRKRRINLFLRWMNTVLLTPFVIFFFIFLTWILGVSDLLVTIMTYNTIMCIWILYMLMEDRYPTDISHVKHHGKYIDYNSYLF